LKCDDGNTKRARGSPAGTDKPRGVVPVKEGVRPRTYIIA